jgi:hypothetical protein
LRVLIMPKKSEASGLMMGKAYRELDERKKKALFYAALALEEAFSDYRTALRKLEEAFGACGKDVEECEKVMRIVEVGEEPFKKDVYMADLGKLAQLAKEEETAFESALNTLRKRLNEYAVRHGLGDLLNVDMDNARELAEAEHRELSRFSGVNFGVKALAALIAYREYALGRRNAFGVAVWYWLEVGGSAQLLYYAPHTAYSYAERAKAEKPAAVEELAAEALRRLLLKPGADHLHGFIEELTKGGRLALMLERETKSKKTESYVIKLFRREGGGLVKLGVKLRISKVGEGIFYSLEFDDAERWQGFFRQEIEAAKKAAEVVRERLRVEDGFPYMGGWVASDVAIVRNKNKRVLLMGTSYLWQLAETHALFDWSDIVVSRVNLTLEGPKPLFQARISLDKLDEAIRRSAEVGWLKTLGIKAESWDGLKRWVVENWDVVVDAAVRRLGEGVRGELEALRDRLNDDKVAREVVAPALLLIQAERLGVNEMTLRYFGATVSGAISGDGYVSAARKEVGLTSGEREIALLWAAALAAHGIKAEVRRVGSDLKVTVSGGDAARLAALYFLYGAPLLEGDERVISHKLAEAMKLGAEGLNISWEGLREVEGGAAADLTISVGGIAVKYNVYLRDKIELQFQSTDRSHVELAAQLLKLAGVNAEVKKVGGEKVMWYVKASTDMLAAGREELRKAIAEIVEKVRKSIGEEKAERWLKKLEKGRMLMEGWPKYYVGLSSNGALVVRFMSPNPDSIKQAAQQLRDMGLKEGRHFTVEMPGEGRDGYVYIRRGGLAHAAWLSEHSKDEKQRRLAADFVKLILNRAEEACGGAEQCAVSEKAQKIIEEGKARRFLELNFEKRVEVNDKTYVVKVIGGEAVEENQNGKTLLRIKITAEVGLVEGGSIVNRVKRDYTITYGRYRKTNATEGRAYASVNAPGGRKADAERYSALIKALTDKEPRVRHLKGGRIEIWCGREHLDGFMQYVELADAIEEWLEKTSRRAGSSTSQL